MSPSGREIFANNLNRLMQLKGVNQADVSSALKVSRTAVSEWSRALKYPRIDTMQRLADYFEVPMQSLTLEQKRPDSKLAEFIELYGKLTEEQKRFVLQSMKGLLEGR